MRKGMGATVDTSAVTKEATLTTALDQARATMPAAGTLVTGRYVAPSTSPIDLRSRYLGERFVGTLGQVLEKMATWIVDMPRRSQHAVDLKNRMVNFLAAWDELDLAARKNEVNYEAKKLVANNKNTVRNIISSAKAIESSPLGDNVHVRATGLVIDSALLTQAAARAAEEARDVEQQSAATQALTAAVDAKVAELEAAAKQAEDGLKAQVEDAKAKQKLYAAGGGVAGFLLGKFLK